jgi:hypothetical protein
VFLESVPESPVSTEVQPSHSSYPLTSPYANQSSYGRSARDRDASQRINPLYSAGLPSPVAYPGYSSSSGLVTPAAQHAAGSCRSDLQAASQPLQQEAVQQSDPAAELLSFQSLSVSPFIAAPVVDSMYTQVIPAALVSALNQQQGVGPIQKYGGGDALTFTRWSRAVRNHVKQHFRSGTMQAARCEVVLGEISSHLTGGLAQWHVRSWRMTQDLHMHAVVDWIASGATVAERAQRCRSIINATAAEDLVGSPLENMLRAARALY